MTLSDRVLNLQAATSRRGCRDAFEHPEAEATEVQSCGTRRYTADNASRNSVVALQYLYAHHRNTAEPTRRPT